MNDLTKDNSKFGQIPGEAMTAVSLWQNIGTWVKISNLPKDYRSCIICGAEEDTQAEHLVDKACGGNHTKHNVIPVCRAHKKPSHKKYRVNWELYYAPWLDIIYSHVGKDDSLRLNPYHEQNQVLGAELREATKEFLNNWRTKKGLI